MNNRIHYCSEVIILSIHWYLIQRICNLFRFFKYVKCLVMKIFNAPSLWYFFVQNLTNHFTKYVIFINMRCFTSCTFEFLVNRTLLYKMKTFIWPLCKVNYYVTLHITYLTPPPKKVFILYKVILKIWHGFCNLE